MTHAERAARRKRLADDVRNGTPVEEVCRREIVSVMFVRSACREHGVSVRASLGMEKTVDLVADIVNSDKTLWQLSLEHDVEFSRATKVYRKCVDAGLPVRLRRRGRPKKERA